MDLVDKPVLPRTFQTIQPVQQSLGRRCALHPGHISKTIPRVGKLPMMQLMGKVGHSLLFRIQRMGMCHYSVLIELIHVIVQINGELLDRIFFRDRLLPGG